MWCKCSDSVFVHKTMASEGDAVKVEGGHVSVTTISMSGSETSNGKSKINPYYINIVSICISCF